MSTNGSERDAPFIRLENFSLSFPVLHGSARSLKKSLLKSVKRSVGRGMGHQVGGAVHGDDVLLVQALDHVSFEAGPGERIGLIGHNGAGKSTLLRALAGIYESSVGSLTLHGETHALLDPMAGMNRDLTGRENIRLFARYNDLERVHAVALERDVESFAGLGAFIDLPVRLYSSGMAVRLGFALATAPRPQILLMDEWFLAGDQHFQDKAEARLTDLVAHADIMIVTSHSMPILRRWCTRILWMEHGRVRMDGPASIVIDTYLDAVAGETLAPAPAEERTKGNGSDGQDRLTSS